MISRLKAFTRKKEAWPIFAAKIAFSLAVFALIALLLQRYTFGFDSQEDRCLPDHFFYMIDKSDTHMQRGNLYAFQSRNVAPLFEDGDRMLKKLVALPGDSVAITSEQEVIVNGEVIAQGLELAEIIGRSAADFVGSGVLGPNQYWFAGETPTSFDSRYWGVVTHEQIIGRAYPLL